MGGTMTIDDLERFKVKKPDFELTEKAIDLAIYFYDLQERAPVIDAVCDAIEGFCEAVCTDTGCMNIHGYCTSCGARVVERFEIIGGGDE